MRTLLLLPLLLWPGQAVAQEYAPSREKPPEPLREFRAAWIATVHNIDWPSRRGLSAAAQKAELLRLFDRAQALRLNALILQVRPNGDALYRSSLEPWSHWLTGQMGRSPGYDPLAFAVEEAHKRGLELHAWFNPFRAIASPSQSVSSQHISQTHPQHLRRYGKHLWLDPGEPFVRERALRVIEDVTRRYDIDGIHIDDYFYPYPSGAPVGAFPDDATYRQYGRGDRNDWRRDNVNLFVQQMYGRVKRAKPWVKVGISPFGIWRPGVPRSIEASLDAYDHLYADSRKWLQNGWLDYLSPQLYWRIRPAKQSFPVLLEWWEDQNRKNRHLWPGIATSRIQSSEDPGRPASEITNQIDYSRKLVKKPSTGHIHWSFTPLQSNKGGINDRLASTYRQPALVPESRWLPGGNAPQPALEAKIQNGGWLRVRWGAQDGNVRWWLVQARYGKAWHHISLVPGKQREWGFTPQSGRPLPNVISVRAIAPNGELGKASVVAYGR